VRVGISLLLYYVRVDSNRSAFEACVDMITEFLHHKNTLCLHDKNRCDVIYGWGGGRTLWAKFRVTGRRSKFLL
jgi:hypothetical protein